MDTAKRQELIEIYGRGVADLKTTLEEIPQEMWQFKPEPTEWSVHEIIIHLADSETNSFLRARRLAVEPGKPIMGYDQDVWANELDYHNQSWEDALSVLTGVRKMTYEFIKTLDEAIWENTVVHPEYDEPYTFKQWLQIYAGHIPAHIAQIKNNYQVWKAQA